MSYDTTSKEIVYETSGKSFVIDHPLDDSKYLVHNCVEGPLNGVYYRGSFHTVDKIAKITLPDYVDKFSYDFTVIATPHISNKNNIQFCNLAVSDIVDNHFYVYSDYDCTFNFIVYANRGHEFGIEPNKNDVIVNGDGPYKYIN